MRLLIYSLLIIDNYRLIETVSMRLIFAAAIGPYFIKVYKRHTNSLFNDRRTLERYQLTYNHLKQKSEEKIAMETANVSIEDFFKGLDADRNPVANHPGKSLSDTINKFLGEFFGHPKESRFEISNQSLKNILEK